MMMNVLLGFLIIVAIICILLLCKIFKNLADVLKNINKIVIDNKRSIDISILEASKNLEETAKLLKTINMKEREVRELLDNLDTTSKNIADMTTTASNFITKGEEITENIGSGFKNINKVYKTFSKKGDNND